MLRFGHAYHEDLHQPLLGRHGGLRGGHLCRATRARGHEVHPVCYEGSRIHRELTNLGFRPLLLNLWGKVHPLAALKLARYVRRHGIELVHCDYSRDLFTVVPALGLAGRPPLVLQKHVGTWKPKNLPVHPYLYGRVDHVVTISTCIHDNFIANHPIDPQKVSVIHPGTDMERFRASTAARAAVRREFGLAENDQLIGTIGRLSRAKGHGEFLDMAGRIAPAFPQTRFVLVGEATRGENEQADALMAQAEALDLGDRLFFTGFRKDIPDVLAAMDLFVFPTHAEAFGMVIVEAMATGVATISADRDGVLDIITHGETGWLVDPHDGEAIAAAVAQLLTDGDLRQRLADSGRRHVRDAFTEDVMYRKFEELYADLRG